MDLSWIERNCDESVDGTLNFCRLATSLDAVFVDILFDVLDAIQIIPSTNFYDIYKCMIKCRYVIFFPSSEWINFSFDKYLLPEMKFLTSMPTKPFDISAPFTQTKSKAITMRLSYSDPILSSCRFQIFSVSITLELISTCSVPTW